MGTAFYSAVPFFFHKMGPLPARSVPVDFYHCPTVAKPGKKGTELQWQEYGKAQKAFKLSIIGAQRIKELRGKLDADGYTHKQLVMSVDGSYTNETVIKQLPANVTLIGRIRKDTKLYELPEPQATGAGRKKVYGKQLPTPEQIRQSDQYPWQSVKAWAAGKAHDFDIKIADNVRWRKAGNINLKLIVIRPIAYKKSKSAHTLYREPAYLICTNPELAVQTILQAYLWRWDIEVNFKEQKSLLGCGQAQVRREAASQAVPAFVTATYSFMLLAAAKAKQTQLPRPKWYKANENKRTTTGDVLNQFKANTWADYANINFSSFVNLYKNQRSHINSCNPALNSFFFNRN